MAVEERPVLLALMLVLLEQQIRVMLEGQEETEMGILETSMVVAAAVREPLELLVRITLWVLAATVFLQALRVLQLLARVVEAEQVSVTGFHLAEVAVAAMVRWKEVRVLRLVRRTLVLVVEEA